MAARGYCPTLTELFAAAGHRCASCLSGCEGLVIWGVGGCRSVGGQYLGSSGPRWGCKLLRFS